MASLSSSHVVTNTLFTLVSTGHDNLIDSFLKRTQSPTRSIIYGPTTSSIPTRAAMLLGVEGTDRQISNNRTAQ